MSQADHPDVATPDPPADIPQIGGAGAGVGVSPGPPGHCRPNGRLLDIRARVQRAKMRIMRAHGIHTDVIARQFGCSDKTAVAICKYYGGYRKDLDFQDEVYVDPQFLLTYPPKSQTNNAASNAHAPSVDPSPSTPAQHRASTSQAGPSNAPITPITSGRPVRTRRQNQFRMNPYDLAPRPKRRTSNRNGTPTRNEDPDPEDNAEAEADHSNDPTHTPDAKPNSDSDSHPRRTSRNQDFKAWLADITSKDLSHLHSHLVKEGITMEMLPDLSTWKRKELHVLLEGVRPRIPSLDRSVLVRSIKAYRR
ncbi:hypothetical protein AX16_004856 [Volvariella volvacea WC 439]|nr:hypothetical protein AX16_004856 [Volvariella volvacea WC 439]